MRGGREEGRRERRKRVGRKRRKRERYDGSKGECGGSGGSGNEDERVLVGRGRGSGKEAQRGQRPEAETERGAAWCSAAAVQCGRGGGRVQGAGMQGRVTARTRGQGSAGEATMQGPWARVPEVCLDEAGRTPGQGRWDVRCEDRGHRGHRGTEGAEPGGRTVRGPAARALGLTQKVGRRSIHGQVAKRRAARREGEGGGRQGPLSTLRREGRALAVPCRACVG